MMINKSTKQYLTDVDTFIDCNSRRVINWNKLRARDCTENTDARMFSFLIDKFSMLEIAGPEYPKTKRKIANMTTNPKILSGENAMTAHIMTMKRDTIVNCFKSLSTFFLNIGCIAEPMTANSVTKAYKNPFVLSAISNSFSNGWKSVNIAERRA